MADNYVEHGDSVAWTNGTGSAVVSGQVVVLGTTADATIGVAAVDIANGATGTVHLEGVFTVPKVSGAVFAQGESLIWDASAAAFDDNQATPASGDVSGSVQAFAAGSNGQTTATVRLLGIPGTKTA